MRNNYLVTGFIATLVISIGLGFASVYGGRLAHQDDLGQIVYMLMFFFPATALATGAIARMMVKRMWSAPIITLLSFLVVMLSAFRNVNFIYILAYMLISILGYGIVFLLMGKSRK